MYFPILRGRQFELLALRECVNQGLRSVYKELHADHETGAADNK